MEIQLAFWPIIGAAIGMTAAAYRGYSKIGGLIGGALLGPLAFLMFFVSGIFTSNETKCPFCAERIKKEAIVCPHCHKDLN